MAALGQAAPKGGVIVAVDEGSEATGKVTHPSKGLARVSFSDASAGWRQVFSSCADVAGDHAVGLGRRYPAIRAAAARRVIDRTAAQNALIGLVFILPGADMPAMTLNQIKMVLSIASIYGEKIDRRAGRGTRRDSGNGLRFSSPGPPVGPLDAGIRLGAEGCDRLHGDRGRRSGSRPLLRERGSRLHQPGGGSRAHPEALSQTAVQLRFESILSRIRQPARLIGNETGAGPGFSGRTDELRVVLGFPDVYEIGISNQAIQILYHLAAGVRGRSRRAHLPALGGRHRRDAPRGSSSSDPGDVEPGGRSRPAGTHAPARVQLHERPGIARSGGRSAARIRADGGASSRDRGRAG